ncbi:uncharacterized protein STEHIDRAFT_95696 [Stereum hirsutum FP-91666 SS1]|uniref:uncharacterized protein n=1 Tax=Stereum hirsutum (strain FP-91666) TaxID=721885 RepID=UPI000440C42F|nr:uncharacterized protein STEHIDRAFT_95696 [Stereum hirsutum FP-91666 SS1]EIM88475.1 hypothetical protein STEHIDRAFT_95696 [Stereum hirsutum FP-91666 SS1]
MPVPVPFQDTARAHPVNKHAVYPGHQHQARSDKLTLSLPCPPPGHFPSFGSREEWPSALSSSRSDRPRRIWEEDDTHHSSAQFQGFPNGLANAGNASAIKGDRAQACIPPGFAHFSHPDQYPSHSQAQPQPDWEEEADDEMSFNSLDYEIESQWSASSPDSQPGPQMALDTHYLPPHHQGHDGNQSLSHDGEDTETATYSPTYDGTSPEPDDGVGPASSPLGPVTPFGDFVDRAVSATVYHPAMNVPYQPQMFALPPTYVHPPAHPVEVPAVVDPVAPPSATTAYKKVADPLAEWMASYVWKACIMGTDLPPSFVASGDSPLNRHSSIPPTYLASSIRSLFMSTLLQPTAIVLAVWYIVHLPVYFGPVSFSSAQQKETLFRAELFGYHPHERMHNEQQAPYRLVLLGCMLANKWLDDHTFSNKTWHTISNVPIQSLNRLEACALEVFSHDLSVSPEAWSKWLQHTLAGHISSSTSSQPQPISRPSSNPHSIVRKTLDDLIEAVTVVKVAHPCSPSCGYSHYEPVFLGLEERKKEKLGLGESSNHEIMEIDLDEDGPLREEYIPRRRTSVRDTSRDSQREIVLPSLLQHCDWQMRERTLPPPAKWSPAADEPIRRDDHRVQSQYVAVQPSMAPPSAPILGPVAPFLSSVMHVSGYPPQPQPIWDPMYQVQPRVQLPPIYPQYSQGYDNSSNGAPAQPIQSHPHVHNHTRSSSSYLENYAPGHGQQHNRSLSQSYSQSQFGHLYSDARMAMQKLPTPPELHWHAMDRYGYGHAYGRPFGQESMAPYQPTWIRA